ncbi:MAG: TonB family protein [Desulfurella sp.]|uniref:energy transducer TonB n=1 Tax=Desulfurella sp. TaxID=1962857 RepID=UPI003D0B4FF5
MQRLTTHSKPISWALAFLLNMAIVVGFAQLFKLYTIKTSKIYTVDIYNVNQYQKTIRANQTLTQIKPENTKKSLFQKIPKNDISNQTINHNRTLITQKAPPLKNDRKFFANAQNDNESLTPTNQSTNQPQTSPIQSPQTTTVNTNSPNTLANPIDIQNTPQIANWIEKHKFYPQEAIFKGEEGKIKLVFLIDKNGYLKNISILEKSPYDSLNKAAIKIIHNSSPVPQKLLTNVNLPFYAKINIIFKLE